MDLHIPLGHHQQNSELALSDCSSCLWTGTMADRLQATCQRGNPRTEKPPSEAATLISEENDEGRTKKIDEPTQRYSVSRLGRGVQVTRAFEPVNFKNTSRLSDASSIDMRDSESSDDLQLGYIHQGIYQSGLFRNLLEFLHLAIPYCL